MTTLDELRERGLFATAEYFASLHRVTVKAMISRSRGVEETRARHEFAAWLVEHEGFSAAGVGRLLGRDHTTILAAIRKCGAQPKVRVAV